MELLTEELAAKLPPLYSTALSPKKRVWIVYKNVANSFRFFVTEGQQLSEDDFEFYGYVTNDAADLYGWQFFTLRDLRAMKSEVYGVGVTRIIESSETPKWIDRYGRTVDHPYQPIIEGSLHAA